MNRAWSLTSQTLGAGVIADVFRADERGFAMGIYTLGPLVGPFTTRILW